MNIKYFSLQLVGISANSFNREFLLSSIAYWVLPLGFFYSYNYFNIKSGFLSNSTPSLTDGGLNSNFLFIQIRKYIKKELALLPRNQRPESSFKLASTDNALGIGRKV